MLSTKQKYHLIFHLYAIPILLFALVIPRATANANEENAFLNPEQAFKLNARLLNDQEIELNFSIAPGYFLYLKYFQFKTLTGENIETSTVQFPPATLKHDTTLEETYSVYANQLKCVVPIQKPQPNLTTSGLRVAYQGCAENGFCYSPIMQQLSFEPAGNVDITTLTPEQFNALSPHMNETETVHSVETESDRITLQLQTGSVPFTLLFFLGLGILLAFTPCVLPMIPIMANILTGEQVPLSSRRAVLLASLYVLSAAFCYAIAGVLAGLAGEQLQCALQTPIFLTSLSFLLLLFALSQFNLIQVHLPQFFSHTLHRLQHKQKQGSALGAIVMGGISALMVSPCVTPALVGALTYIGQTGNAVLGGLALFAMAVGMGLPLLVVACIGSHLLPKAGRWMGLLKIITGIFLLALAASLLIRAFPQTEDETKIPQFISIHNEQELEAALQTAKSLNKAVILDVYADWCISCRQLDQTLFADPQVLTTLNYVTLLRLDMTKQTAENLALEKKLNILGPPTLLFFNTNGTEAKNYRIVGTIESFKFINKVRHFLQLQPS